jgi:hypothetical protein
MMSNLLWYECTRLSFSIRRKSNGVIVLWNFWCVSKRMMVTIELCGATAMVWHSRVNKTGSFVDINIINPKRYIKISLTICEILITGTNNVIKLVRFADFSLCRFSVRVNERYSRTIVIFISSTLSFLNDPYIVPYNTVVIIILTTTQYLTRVTKPCTIICDNSRSHDWTDRVTKRKDSD